MSEQFIYSQKNNFSGGELTPTIEGRTELGLYQNGAKKLINFIILPSGGIMRRHGTEFIYKFTNADRNAPTWRKIISVMFSRELSYLLVFECKDNKTSCSFFVNGDLFVTTIPIKDEGRDFAFKLKDFSYTCFGGVAYINFGSDKPIFKFSIDPKIVEELYNYIQTIPRTNTNPPAASVPRGTTDNRPLSREERERILVNYIPKYEPKDRAIAANFPNKHKMFIIEPLKAYVAYYKQMQNNRVLQRPFNEVIYNAEIDRINDVLKGLHAAGAANIYEQKQEKLNANLLVTFENRLWCFGVNNNMHLIWASYKGDFNDFRMSYKTLLEARNPLTALSATFTSSTFDNVLWTVPFSTEMLLGTTDGIYLIKEGDRGKGEFIKIHKELDVPVSLIKPVIIGKTIFFVDGSERKINSLYYSQEKGGFQISDITAYAEHIFNVKIKQIVGINSPFSMIFAVLKDGSFASFTYSQDLKIMGWSKHRLGGSAIVLSITPVYLSNEDKLYFHVKRSFTFRYPFSAEEYLEVMHTKYFTAQNSKLHKPIYLDCHINITLPEENKLTKDIKNNSNNPGELYKIILQMQKDVELDIDKVDINNSFKYMGRYVGDFEGDMGEHVTTFIKRYYKRDRQIIIKGIAHAFAFCRFMQDFCRVMETTLLTGQYENLGKTYQLIQNADYMLDHIHSFSSVHNFNPEGFMLDRILVQYMPNEAFSFRGNLYYEIRRLDTDIVESIKDSAKEIQGMAIQRTSDNAVKNEIFSLIEKLQINLKNFKKSIIQICLPLLIPKGTKLGLLQTERMLEDENNIKFEKYLALYQPSTFKKLFPYFTPLDLSLIAGRCCHLFSQIKVADFCSIYEENLYSVYDETDKIAIVTDDGAHLTRHSIQAIESDRNSKDRIISAYPVKYFSVGYGYNSILQTFPFIFPDEVEHSHKSNVEIGVKVFNTAGGYIKEKFDNGKIFKHYIHSEYRDLDHLVRFKGQKEYSTAEEQDTPTTPYKSGWMNFILQEQIKQDVEFTFVVNTPYPASILKIYAKAKILPSYKSI